MSVPISVRRVFLTGGSGFAGRNIIRHYLRAGAEVMALVRSEKAQETVSKLGAIPVRGELIDASLGGVMSGCDLLIHAAANTDHGYASTQQWQANVDGTQRLFATAKAAGIPRAIHLSTESVLLTGKPLRDATEVLPLPVRFVGGYSKTKALAEQAALAQASDDFSVMVVRPRFVWGKDDTTALPMLMTAVKAGQFAWIAGGNYLTSTTHIDNLCAGIHRAVEFGRNREIYFITDGEPHRFRDFVTRLLATQQIIAPEKQVPRWLVKTLAVLGDVAFNVSGGRIKSPVNMQIFATSAVEVTLNITKARDELGYQPVISIEQGMSELGAMIVK